MKRKDILSILFMVLLFILIIPIHEFHLFKVESKYISEVSLNDFYGFGVQCMKGQTVEFLFDHHQGDYMDFYIEWEDFQQENSEILYSRDDINFASFIMNAPETGWMSINVEAPDLKSERFEIFADKVSNPITEIYITGIFIRHPKIMEINWNASNQIENINLSLFKNETLLGTINTTIDASLGILDWKINNTLSGEDFQVKIEDSNNSSLSDFSEYISIDPPVFEIPSFIILIVISSVSISFIIIKKTRKFKITI
ncbi:MAG: hypothetical protein EU543_01165 [Promethearchaeota archaeon]|nr:MAG: hypothetical protein EU543_01165 [Candidatus Lokiarchaeota archaeon]